MIGRIIYDFGMNNGDDVEYYLLKGARVVGIEANRALCEEVRARFANAIECGQLVVVNVVLSDQDSRDPVPFYLHKTNHVLSQLPKPSADEIGSFEEVMVPCRTPSSVIGEFGEPRYVKIDLERCDLGVLKNIFDAGIFPPEISAESHEIGVFVCLVAAGYDSFNLVDGPSVHKVYGRTTVATPEGQRSFSFRRHSAGPFGDDIRSPWEDADTFFYRLAAAGLGWKDIHASKDIAPVPRPAGRTLVARQAAALLGRALRGMGNRLLG